MSHFWDTLPKGFIGLAPMDGVTDAIYRYIVAQQSKPDLIITEFTNVEGLSKNAVTLLKQFEYHEIERPIVAQVYGLDPEAFYISAIIVAEMGFDGMDINMGCPAKKVSHRGAGAGLILNPTLAKEIIEASKAGLKDYYEGKISVKDLKLKNKMKEAIYSYCKGHEQKERRLLPLSIKTRIGYDTEVVEKWISHLLSCKPVAISIHGRTLKQMYSGNADWEAIGRAVELAKGTGIKIIGNGDIESKKDAKEKIEKYGVDGVLIGRATFGNPWVFEGKQVNFQQKIDLAIKHCELFEKKVGINYFFVMRKYLGWYIKNHPHAKEMRIQLMRSNSTDEVRKILTNY